jgi:hypothetical protein
MSDGQYIRLDELALLAAFVLLLPAILSVFIQLLVFKQSRGKNLAPKTAMLSIIVTLAGGVVLTLAMMLLLPQGLVRVVGIREVPVLGHSITILPLAFFTFGASAVMSTAWGIKRARGAA